MNYNNKMTIKDLDLKNKKVLIRLDLNVPFQGGTISDDNRIKAALPTLEYLIEQGSKIIVLSHLSRIKTEEDKAKKTLKLVAERMSELLNQKVYFIPENTGPEVETKINALQSGEILVLENTRFQDVKNNELIKAESKNDTKLGKYWASLADVFINDAFGTAHRAHASNVGIAQNIKESAVGFLVEKELKMLAQGIENPERPCVVILGGLKVSEKIGVVDNLIDKADKIIIGGAMAYTFYKALGYTVGDSIVEEDKIEMAKEYLEKAKDKIILPIDTAASQEFANTQPKIFEFNIPDGYEGLDIGPKSIELFKKEIANAKTILWNGPVGVSEFKNYSAGTVAVCEAASKAKANGAYTLIGGGDSAAAAIKFGFKDEFSWISTGGGASLELMKGANLPGIDAIRDKK